MNASGELIRVNNNESIIAIERDNPANSIYEGDRMKSKTIHIGFTGTSKRKMTKNQKNAFVKDLIEIRKEYDVAWFHFGDCINADDQAAELAAKHRFKLHCHPPENDYKRAYTIKRLLAKVCPSPPLVRCPVHQGFKLIPFQFKMEDPKPFLERNRDIVNSSAILLAVPETDEEQLRSGTWATIRYALTRRKEVRIYRPGK